MQITRIVHATRGLNVAALFKLEIPDAADLGPTFLCYFRLSLAGGSRIEEWTRCSPCEEDALDLYRRGVEDFIEPVPFVPARVEPEQPAQFPSLFQVVQGEARSVPMALNAAEREADAINGGES